MVTRVHMEALSPTMEEGQLVRWLISEGESVKVGDVLAEIETDKAVMELVARGDGVLRSVLLAEGDTADVGTVIGVISAEDEDVSGIVGPDGAGGSAEAEPAHGHDSGSGPVERPDPAVASDGDGTSQPSDTVPSLGSAPTNGDDGATTGRVKASPLAKRMAGDLGIELGNIAGSGPGGRVVKRDVEAATSEPARATAPQTAPRVLLGALATLDGPEFVDVPVSQLRKTIARRLSESIGPVPTFYLTISADVTRLLEARRAVNDLLQGSGIKASINDFVLKATAMALARHPECNAHWMGSTIRVHHRVHLGVAVALDDGLITPVIRNANLKGIAHIATEIRELAGQARLKKLQPEQYTGSTFSVSNLGMFGIDEFTAIINPPEAGILAVGGITQSPVVEEGEIVVCPKMRVTMSCDHRVIDGALGARFLATLKAMLEEPAHMLI